MIEYCRAYIYTCAERGEKEVMVIESDRESGKERKKKKIHSGCAYPIIPCIGEIRGLLTLILVLRNVVEST